MTKLHAQQPVHDVHFLLQCLIHLSTSECSWMLFHLFYTLSEDSKAGCYLHLLSCQSYQKQHEHSAGSRVKWQGMHVCFFIFNKGLIWWCQWGDHKDDLISFVTHPLRMWGMKKWVKGNCWRGFVIWQRLEVPLYSQKCESIEKSSD